MVGVALVTTAVDVDTSDEVGLIVGITVEVNVGIGPTVGVRPGLVGNPVNCATLNE